MLAALQIWLAKIPQQVESFASVILPFRPRRTGALWADFSAKGFTHYAVDARVSDAKHAGVVRLHTLFLFADVPFARVTWGTKTSVHVKTGFQGYSFAALSPQDVTRATVTRSECAYANRASKRP